MTPMIRSMLIWLVVTALVLFKANQCDPGKHKGPKAIHSIFVVFLILTHATAFKMLGWTVGHPDKIMEHFYVAKDLFAPWASLTVWTLNTILSPTAIVLGFALARRVMGALAMLTATTSTAAVDCRSVGTPSSN